MNNSWRYLLLVVTILIIVRCTRNDLYQFEGATMGTHYHIVLSAPAQQRIDSTDLQERIDSLLRRINQSMSVYIDSSEISQFNRSRDTAFVALSPALAEVIEKSLYFYQLSGGAFDITVAPLLRLWGFRSWPKSFSPPPDTVIRAVLNKVGSNHLVFKKPDSLRKCIPDLEIDLGGIAKGYGVDCVAELLRKHGFHDFMVEIGGEVVTSGRKAGKKWKIAIEQPSPNLLPGQRIEDILYLGEAAVATSGDYRQFFRYQNKIYSHEIDPASGWPAQHGVASVTVIARDCMTADALATALMIIPPDSGQNIINNLPQTEALWILRDGENRLKKKYSSGFQAFLRP